MVDKLPIIRFTLGLTYWWVRKYPHKLNRLLGKRSLGFNIIYNHYYLRRESKLCGFLEQNHFSHLVFKLSLLVRKEKSSSFHNLWRKSIKLNICLFTLSSHCHLAFLICWKLAVTDSEAPMAQLEFIVWTPMIYTERKVSIVLALCKLRLKDWVIFEMCTITTKLGEVSALAFALVDDYLIVNVSRHREEPLDDHEAWVIITPIKLQRFICEFPTFPSESTSRLFVVFLWPLCVARWAYFKCPLINCS